MIVWSVLACDIRMVNLTCVIFVVIFFGCLTHSLLYTNSVNNFLENYEIGRNKIISGNFFQISEFKKSTDEIKYLGIGMIIILNLAIFILFSHIFGSPNDLPPGSAQSIQRQLHVTSMFDVCFDISSNEK